MHPRRLGRSDPEVALDDLPEVRERRDGLDLEAGVDQPVTDLAEVDQPLPRGALQERPLRNAKPGLPRGLHGAPVAAEHGGGLFRAGHVGSEEAHVIEGRSEGDDAFAGDPLVAGLEADDAAEGGGAEERADRLRAEGQRAEAGADRGGRAAARSPRRVLRVPGIAGGAGREEGELGGDRLAEDQGAGFAEGRHARRLGSGQGLRRQPAAAAGRKAVHVKDVLHPHGDAEEEGPARFIGPAGLERLHLPAQPLEAPLLGEEGAHLGLAPGEARREIVHPSASRRRSAASFTASTMCW